MEMAWLGLFSQNQYQFDEYVPETVFRHLILEVSEAPARQCLELSEAFFDCNVVIDFRLNLSRQ